MRIIITCILLIFLLSLSKEKPTDAAFIPPTKPKLNKDSLFLKSIEYLDKREPFKELYVLHPTFRNKVIKLIYECRKQGIDLRVVETYRTPERQEYLKRKRHTKLSGGNSKHQHFIAVDVVPVVDNLPRWHDTKLWKKIGKIGKSEGLIWGGDWKKFYDPGHFEYPVEIPEIYTIVYPDTILIPL